MADAPASPKTTPLWIISIFIGLSQAVAGLVATQVSGWIAAMLAVFAVVYPTVITGVFFWLLLTRNWLFYTPGEYSKDVTPRDYIAAIRAARLSSEAISSSIEAGIKVSLGDLQDVSPTKREHLIEEAIARAQFQISKNTIAVDRTIFGREFEGDPIVLYVDQGLTVSDLLNNVYFAIADFVASFTYGDQWILQDTESGKIYSDMGTLWARQHGRGIDDRSLEEVGIPGGVSLKIIKPRRH